MCIRDRYKTFLRTFLTAFVAEMKRLGVDKQCLYHISDEPSLVHLENYKRAKAQINDIISDYVIMDALSDFEFYRVQSADMSVQNMSVWEKKQEHVRKKLAHSLPG